MTKASRFLALLLSTFISTLCVLPSTFCLQADTRPVPLPPQTYVLDEPNVLTEKTRETLRQLLKAQNDQTSEQIVIAIFKSLEGEDLSLWTNQIFKEWKIGEKGKDNGVLLALYWNDRKARIEVGYQLEALLTDSRSKQILSEALAPHLRAGQPNEALTLTTLEILSTLKSPLLENGTAEKILGGKLPYRKAMATPLKPNPISSLIWLITGGVIVLIIYRAFFSSSDKHFSRSQFRPRRRGLHRNWDESPNDNPFRMPQSRSGSSSNSSSDSSWPRDSGGGGDDTGFRGGGGRSGGGGANQGW